MIFSNNISKVFVVAVPDTDISLTDPLTSWKKSVACNTLLPERMSKP